MSSRPEAPNQPIDHALNAAIEPRRHLDFGVCGDDDAH
jgi:hypothetical protein